jgi:membrane fusion protein (multidrug efflux system)
MFDYSENERSFSMYLKDKSSMLSKFKYASGALLIMLLAGCEEQASSNAAAPQAPKVEVGVVVVAPQKVVLTTELPGRTASSLVAEIRPQVGGIVQKRLFEEGQDVKEGQPLYQLDDSTYVATYNQAQADLDSSAASLKSAELTYNRYKVLRKQNNVSQSDLDDVYAAYLEAVASEKKAKASVENAKIDLEHTKVRSPISGRIGISQVTVGALVTASQTTVMATVRSLDPIFVDLSQTSLDQLNKRNLLNEPNITKSDNKVSLVLEDGTTYEHQGVLKAREVSVDESTGSVTLRAEFPNPDDKLLPGMFVRGEVNEAVDSAAIIVPQQAVFRNAKGQAVSYVVNTDNKIEQRILTTARTFGNQWMVTSGLKAGDKVVVEGSSKVRIGSDVSVVQLQFDSKTDTMKEISASEASSSN